MQIHYDSYYSAYVAWLVPMPRLWVREETIEKAREALSEQVNVVYKAYGWFN